MCQATPSFFHLSKLNKRVEWPLSVVKIWLQQKLSTEQSRKVKFCSKWGKMLKTRFRFLNFYSLLSLLGLAVLFFYHRSSSSASRMVGNTKSQPPGNMAEHFQTSGPPGVEQNSTTKTLEPCPDTPPDLVGPLHVEFETKRTLDEVRKQVGSFLQLGGRYKPPNCVSRQKVGQETSRLSQQ